MVRGVETEALDRTLSYGVIAPHFQAIALHMHYFFAKVVTG